MNDFSSFVSLIGSVVMAFLVSVALLFINDIKNVILLQGIYCGGVNFPILHLWY